MTIALTSISSDDQNGQLPTKAEIDDLPWKYIGYKGFISYVASDPDLFALRRFDRLHTRCLFTHQAHPCALERELDDLDEHYSARTTKIVNDGHRPPNAVTTESSSSEDYRDINNGTVVDDMPKRAELILKINDKLKEYDRMVLEYSSIRSIPKAPVRVVRNLRNWFWNHPGAIAEHEFIQHEDELVSIAAHKSILRQLFEQHVIVQGRHRFKLFEKKIPQGANAAFGPGTYMFDDERVNAFGALVLFLAAVLLLIAPLWILRSLQDLDSRLAVITVFVVLWLSFLSVSMLGRPFEILAATAGYSAVLVVFLQLQ